MTPTLAALCRHAAYLQMLTDDRLAATLHPVMFHVKPNPAHLGPEPRQEAK